MNLQNQATMPDPRHVQGVGNIAPPANPMPPTGAGSFAQAQPPLTPVTAGSAGTPNPKARKPKGSTIQQVHGQRTVKQYPIQEPELEDLFKTGVAATILFSASAWLGNAFVSILVTLSLTTGLPDKIISLWSIISMVSAILAVILFVIGLFFVYNGKNKITAIKKDTTF
ncbi:hypothetical protein [Sideroxydans lithotrophicus]|nr:hypothetical protein [Sideroxydans lithotrophicus]